MALKLTIHFHLLPRLRMNGVVPLVHLYAFMAWTGRTLHFISDYYNTNYNANCENNCISWKKEYLSSHCVGIMGVGTGRRSDARCNSALDAGSGPFYARIAVDPRTISNLAPPCYEACRSTCPITFYRSVIWIPKAHIKSYAVSDSTAASYSNVLCLDIYQVFTWSSSIPSG
jgi:hypothetical protein